MCPNWSAICLRLSTNPGIIKNESVYSHLVLSTNELVKIGVTLKKLWWLVNVLKKTFLSNPAIVIMKTISHGSNDTIRMCVLAFCNRFKVPQTVGRLPFPSASWIACFDIAISWFQLVNFTSFSLKMTNLKYELVLGMNRGHKTVKNERKPRPSSKKGVCIQT